MWDEEIKGVDGIYTLSQSKNDRDVTERAQGYTLQDASHPLCINPGVPF